MSRLAQSLPVESWPVPKADQNRGQNDHGTETARSNDEAYNAQDEGAWLAQ